MSETFPIAIVALAVAGVMPAQNTGALPERIAGVRRGNSICAVRESPCHDEVNVYRIARVSERPDRFQVTGSKIVDGKEIGMGTGEWIYDEASHVLGYDGPAGTFRLRVKDGTLAGDLTLTDGTVFRHISLRREN